MRDIEFNKIYGSDHSDVNPKVKSIIDIAKFSKTTKECNKNEKEREDTKVCMNNMERARKTSYFEVAQAVREEDERRKIEERRNRDLSFDDALRSEDFGIGE